MGKIFFATFIALLVLASCKPLDSTVGSTSDTQINSLAFTVDTSYIDIAHKRLVARGTVKNNSRVTVTSPWYVEGQFYTDDSFDTKLGGNNTEIGVPLSPGQQTFWTIYFSSTNVDVMQYPEFRVSDLRGIYK